MKLLLDTHTALWFASASTRLSERARTAIFDPDNEVALSAVVPWEVAIKRALGKLESTDDYLQMIEDRRAMALAVTIDHARAVERLPHLHRDPFDRLLIAQAQVEHAVIVTDDEKIKAYSVQTLW